MVVGLRIECTRGFFLLVGEVFFCWCFFFVLLSYNQIHFQSSHYANEIEDKNCFMDLINFEDRETV